MTSRGGDAERWGEEVRDDTLRRFRRTWRKWLDADTGDAENLIAALFVDVRAALVRAAEAGRRERDEEVARLRAQLADARAENDTLFRLALTRDRIIASLRSVLAPLQALAEKVKPEPLAWELHAENEWSIGVVLHRPRDGQDAGDGYIVGQVDEGEGDVAMAIAHNGLDSRGAAWPALIVAAVNALPALTNALATEAKPTPASSPTPEERNER